MKRSLLFLLILCGCTALYAQANAPAPVIEPQYINSFYALGTDARLTELERKTVQFHSKSRVFPGYASVKMMAEVKPAQSPVRLASNARFIVRGRAPIDPVSRFELRLLKRAKDHREILLSQAHGSIVGGESTGLDELTIPIRFEEYGDYSYRITPERPLEPGEYALKIRGHHPDLYCFGVDR